jgi:hypothetical protein
MLALIAAGRLEAQPSLWDDPAPPAGAPAARTTAPIDANGWPAYTAPPQGVLLADPDKPAVPGGTGAPPAPQPSSPTPAPYRTGIAGSAVSAAAQAAAVGLAVGLAGGSVSPNSAAARTIQTLAGAVSSDTGQGHGH